MFRPTWHRAAVRPGRCVVCNCTPKLPCDFHAQHPLWWVDTTHTVCAAPACLRWWLRTIPGKAYRHAHAPAAEVSG